MMQRKNKVKYKFNYFEEFSGAYFMIQFFEIDKLMKI